MSLASMFHAIFSPPTRGEDTLAALNEERVAAREAHDAAVARVQQSTSDLRHLVDETVDRIGNRNRRNGRH